MCGIVGINHSDKRVVRKMAFAISHRGPDQDGIFVDDHVSLGHRRLSIIDLSERGKQPMHNENEDVWIVFNGEIYNHEGIREVLEKKGHKYASNTDTETIIHGYEEYGSAIVEKLNGDFAFCIYDSIKKRLFLARDRIGVKPLYYYYDPKKKLFGFASEIKALLEHPAVNRSVNSDALRQFLQYRYIFSAQTILKNIYRLPPAHILIFDLQNKTFVIKRYWNVDTSAKNILNVSEAEHVARYKNLLIKSTERRLMSDVPLGAYLSGGLDSSSVVASLAHVKKQLQDNDPIRTFSIGFSEGVNELPYARTVAEHFHTSHTEIMIESDATKLLPQIVYHMDEPLADPAEIPVFVLSQHTKKNGVTVILTGDGGDETLAGYEQAKFITFVQPLCFIPSPIRQMGVRFALNILSLSVKNKLFKYASKFGDAATERAVELMKDVSSLSHTYKSITALFTDNELNALSANPVSAQDYLSPYLPPKSHPLLNRILALELRTLLPENMLMKSDKMTMAWAIEGRVPLLDHELVEYTYKMPSHMKLHGVTEKYVLKKAVQPWLPKSILHRKKQRFYVPIDNWLQKDLSGMMDKLLDPNIINVQGYFVPEAIEKIKSKYEHAPLYYARQLWTLLSFQLWHAIFIEQRKLKELI